MIQMRNLPRAASSAVNPIQPGIDAANFLAHTRHIQAMENELKQFEQYLLNPGTENAKDHLVFPLFQKLFGSKFKKESDAEGADLYIEGKLLVELKTEDFIKGFYQALHYVKKGLTFSAVCVVAQKFVAVWKVNSIPDFAKRLSAQADATVAPNDIGVKNARATSKAEKLEIFKSAIFKLDATDLEGLFNKGNDTDLRAFIQVLKNLDADRIQINRHNFIDQIEQLEKFFPDDQMGAIHCFYAIVGFWDVTSKVGTNEADEIFVVRGRDSKVSENLKIKPKFHEAFKKFVEQRFIFTNEGSGLTVDYYFSRFDEVITRIKPEYAKQHGIFFTDNNLSKFALWFVHEYFEKRLSDKYIVLDPAGGSGNLVTSWRGHLKRKIISELQPNLLKTIERRMKLDPDQLDGGFTIIPKTSKNEGLNFLDKSAEKYLSCLMNELKEQNFKFDKPIAFLLNPPYKNTDENEKERDQVEAAYAIDQSILDLTGEDAGRERYLAFLGQIINIARVQMGDIQLKQKELTDEIIPLPPPLDTTKVETPLILIFTPTSWLIPRPTYVDFRKIFDTYFKYETGFIILGSEFFKIAGRFPISFTIWSYRRNEKGNKNKVVLRNLTHLKGDDLAEIKWNQGVGYLETALKGIIKGAKNIELVQREDIREQLPFIANVSSGKMVRQTRLNLYRNKLKEEENIAIISGFPKKDDRHQRILDPYGYVDGSFVGFMDDNTPVRIRQDNYNRISNHPDSVWFRLDNNLKSGNKTRIHSGPTDKYGYCAFDVPTAQKLFVWFAITKSLNGKYPHWANQMDIWTPNIPAAKEQEFYSLCFAFGLAENRCVVTKFEKDNPVAGAPEVLVDNPLCPGNKESFWSTTLNREIVASPVLAGELVALVKLLYKKWNQNYTKGQFQYSVGLQDEPYFKYFDYKDFVTPHSGLIQIRKYAENKNAEDLLESFEKISAKTKEVREEIYRLLVEEFGYFE